MTTAMGTSGVRRVPEWQMPTTVDGPIKYPRIYEENLVSSASKSANKIARALVPDSKQCGDRARPVIQ